MRFLWVSLNVLNCDNQNRQRRERIEMELISPKKAREILGVGRNKQILMAQCGTLTRYKVKGVQGYKYDLQEVEALASKWKK